MKLFVLPYTILHCCGDLRGNLKFLKRLFIPLVYAHLGPRPGHSEVKQFPMNPWQKSQRLHEE